MEDFHPIVIFWTSLDTNKVGVNQKSQLLSAQQMANSMFPKQQLLLAPKNLCDNPCNCKNAKRLQKYLSSDQKYDTLQDAYDAYEKLLTEGKYMKYKDTLPEP